MKFIYFLLITLITVFISTIRGLIRVNTTDSMEEMDLIYNFLPKSVYAEKILYQFLSWIVILFTGFFIPVIILLVFIQTKNFTSNRTTSERFSRKKPPVKKNLNKERKSPHTS